jgi:hypothetical protein
MTIVIFTNRFFFSLVDMLILPVQYILSYLINYCFKKKNAYIFRVSIQNHASHQRQYE